MLKHRLRDLLACPGCGAHPLEITVLEADSDPEPPVSRVVCSRYCSWQSEPILDGGREPRPCSQCYGSEITQGILHCTICRGEYPIVDGIPRFNPDAGRDYPDFFRRYAASFRNLQAADLESFNALHSETKRSFGFQWLRYAVSDREEDERIFYDRTGLTPEDLSNKLFFEAGCGMGRYLKIIGSDPAAEVVGLDLSLAVNRARNENRRNPFIYLVQGNIMQLPLRPDTFDFVYSIGVLHHTPDTRQAFKSIVKLAKPGGCVSVWLYHVWVWPELRGLKAVHSRMKGGITDNLRRVTTRMPLMLLHYLCYLAIPFGWLQRRILESPTAIQILFSPLLLVGCSNHPQWRVRLLDTFDWYSPRYQWKHTVKEVEGWFRDAGLTDISTHGLPVSVRGKRPVSLLPAPPRSRDMVSSSGT